MRGIPSLITEIRKKVFTEVARMAYSGRGYEGVDELPYIIVPGDQPLHRESVFLERAIASERVRLAMGLNIRPIQTRHLMTEGMDEAAVAEQYYTPPLINIIPYACHACPTNQYKVSNYCNFVFARGKVNGWARTKVQIGDVKTNNKARFISKSPGMAVVRNGHLSGWYFFLKKGEFDFTFSTDMREAEINDFYITKEPEWFLR